MKWAAVVVAAGRGTRLHGPKQLINLAGLPMVGWSLKLFATMPEIVELVVATESESLEPIRSLLTELAPECAARVVRGGAIRQQSVYEGLRAVSPEVEGVLVHDGARPLVSAADVRAGMGETRAGRAALLATPVVDTIKTVNPQSLRVGKTLDRRTLWAAQTPQFALTAELRAAHERARREGIEATDDAALLERIGIEVVVVPSTSENFKVTHPADVARAQAILAARCDPEPAACHPEPVEG
ncbi:MAG: 2-C-methyl-D-erythritol 4-phosphate cytidylyltransferase [Candidatus Cybelea sp.]